jgi:hypothetical protein
MSPVGRPGADARRGGGWHTPIADDHPAAALLTARAVRERCRAVFTAIETGESAHFSWHPERLAWTADYVVATLRQRFPALQMPCHSRWRHFEAGGHDRWAPIGSGFGSDRQARARARCELALVSVLLDAGAGAGWHYVDAPTATPLMRSEGLGVASLRMYAAGLFSADARTPLRVDAAALARLDPARLAAGFAVSGSNPLRGLAGRVSLLRRLGEVAAATSAVFGTPARIGNLFDHLEALAVRGALPAPLILATLLRALAPVWPARLRLDGIPLGDCWRHPAARVAGAPEATQGYVPLHKLSQWLAYSLFEPLEEAGVSVTAQDELTGLAEYRNGGLLLDAGVLVLRDPALASGILKVHEPAVVEWRAATVIALDLLAERVRAALGVDAEALPLARVLEGGTWAAGRRLAAERRPGGGPPLDIESDGTVF